MPKQIIPYEITKISLAALAAALIAPAAALAHDSIANLKMQTRSDWQPTRSYTRQTTYDRHSHKDIKLVREERSRSTMAVYTGHRGLGEPQHFKTERVSTGNGGDISFEVPAD